MTQLANRYADSTVVTAVMRLLSNRKVQLALNGGFGLVLLGVAFVSVRHFVGKGWPIHHADPVLVAQILAMLEDRLWLDNARAANAAAQMLARAAPDRLLYPVEANEVFLKVTVDEAARLRAQGFDFYDWGPGEIRLVTSWDHDGQAVDRLASALAAL